MNSIKLKDGKLDVFMILNVFRVKTYCFKVV